MIGIAVLAMGLLYLFIERTRAGRAIRAVSEDQETARLMGINVDRTISMVFAVGGAMAGVAGVMYGIVFGQIYFFSGFVPGIKAFTAAVLGGVGNIGGAFVGGMLLGGVESIGPSLVLTGLGHPVGEPTEGRLRVHHPRPRVDLPTDGHPGRAAVGGARLMADVMERADDRRASTTRRAPRSAGRPPSCRAGRTHRRRRRGLPVRDRDGGELRQPGT